jgi:large subunit ribosomal protein L10
MATQAKIDEVALLKGKFETATGIVLADYRGLTANEMVELRRQFRSAGLEYRVVKDTLARIAAREVGLEELAELFAGPIGVALGYEDPAVAFKITETCRKTYQPRYEPRGGIFEGVLVQESEFARYAKLPSREEVLGSLAGVLAAPMRGLAVVLKAKLRELAVVLGEVRKQMEQEKGEDQ